MSIVNNLILEIYNNCDEVNCYKNIDNINSKLQNNLLNKYTINYNL